MRFQDNFKPVFFFFLILNAQKRKSNQNQLTKEKQANKKQQRQRVFARTKISKRMEIVYFAFWCFLYAQNLFIVKKNKRLDIVLITSFTILLTCTGSPCAGAFLCS